MLKKVLRTRMDGKSRVPHGYTVGTNFLNRTRTVLFAGSYETCGMTYTHGFSH